MGEKRAVQHHLYQSSRGELGFVDKKLIKQAVTVVTFKLEEVRGGEGEVIFPQPLSPREQYALRSHPSHIGRRIGYMVEVPLKEGTGMAIQIREKEGFKRR